MLNFRCLFAFAFAYFRFDTLDMLLLDMLTCFQSHKRFASSKEWTFGDPLILHSVKLLHDIKTKPR